MPEPLKNLFNDALILSLAGSVSAVYAKFDAEGFQKSVFGGSWQQKELKQRLIHISKKLHDYLPGDYGRNIDILKPASLKFSGLEHMVFPGYVELYGMEDFETSMSALEFFTEKSSSEFAIRPFIKESPAKTMKQMEDWAASGNQHVRRLASEGCRPRLPWAMALPHFKKDPRAVLKILDKLKNDESLYVRRSVANNLNDISKDNPDVIIDIARQWMGNNRNIDWVVKHACRSLLRQGVPQVMKIFGFEEPGYISVSGFSVQETVAIGERLKFGFTLHTNRQRLGKLRIEYGIDFMKNNGNQKRKIFKISESENMDQEKKISRAHSFKLISTRKYYPGAHGIAVIVNGHALLEGKFQLFDAD